MQKGDHVYYELTSPDVETTLERGKLLPTKRGYVDHVLGDAGEGGGIVAAKIVPENAPMTGPIMCAVMVAKLGFFRAPSWAQAIGVPAPSEEIEKFLDNDDAKCALLRTIRHRAETENAVLLARSVTDAEVEKLLAWIEQAEQRRHYLINELHRERGEAEKSRRAALDDLRTTHARATESMRADVARLAKVREVLGSATVLGPSGTVAAINEAVR